MNAFLALQFHPGDVDTKGIDLEISRGKLLPRTWNLLHLSKFVGNE